MPMVEIRTQVSLEELLHGVAQLDAPELERFVSQVLTLRARRVAPALSREETELFAQINRNLSPADQLRYDELVIKQRYETLTTAEHQELLDLVDIIDDLNLERVQALSELAKLRQTSFTAIMA